MNSIWRKVLSLTVLLLIASIRLIRPIAFSGEMGFVSSFNSSIRSLVYSNSEIIFCFRMALSIVLK
ncbi:hypothetical protein N8833_01560 [Salibacteraceae bacterium]|nr:hypothetical protein [Salibacteraceae bacterium]